MNLPLLAGGKTLANKTVTALYLEVDAIEKGRRAPSSQNQLRRRVHSLNANPSSTLP